MEIQVRQKVKSIMWQTLGKVVLIDHDRSRVYVEFTDSSRHNGWYEINELIVIPSESVNPEPTIVSRTGFSHA